MAIKQREDSTEDGANKEAYKLCCGILSDDEQVTLDGTLKTYFCHNNKVNIVKEHTQNV
jgi:hypothetical protein